MHMLASCRKLLFLAAILRFLFFRSSTLRLIASPNGCLLRRNLRRFSGRLFGDVPRTVELLHRNGRHRINGAFEVLIGDLQIVVQRNHFAVADPSADDVHRKVVDEFRLAGRAKVLERLRPGR